MSKRKLDKPASESERRKRVEVVTIGLEYACPLERYERENNLGWKSLMRAIEDLGMKQTKHAAYPPPDYHLHTYWGLRDGKPRGDLSQDCDLCYLDAEYVRECVWRSGLLDYIEGQRIAA